MDDKKKQMFETTILQIGNNTGICVPDEIVAKLGAGKKPACNCYSKQFYL